MSTKPLDRQSLLDLALQTSGSVEAAFELAAHNDLAISAEVDTARELHTVAAADKAVLNRYTAQSIRPATALTAQDIDIAPYGGVGFMGIEVDFIVS